MSRRFDPERPPKRSKCALWLLSDDPTPFFSVEAINRDNEAEKAYEDALIRWGWRSGQRRERIYQKTPPVPVIVPSPLRAWVDDPRHRKSQRGSKNANR